MHQVDEASHVVHGRVRHDASGRAVWDWAVESGRHAIDSTSRLLKKLELTSLTLMGDEQKNWENKDSGATPPAVDNGTQAEDGAPTFGGPRETDDRGSAKPSATPRPLAVAKHSAKQPGLLTRLFGRGR